ncbi:uncharacterized protein LOC115876193 [Sitophilus oryzae]|uniref:Uncharacterized protein LOC115876193 n=1 Tax=Sitophilus oryzae TaxID=7048 RepID=A0A6J2X966_SITOR|nr:uncharacterized protein LOC115876193 [Sitophilus oryzae]
MVTHWESSQRPLYIRTIWKDGQHHVIFDKSKERPVDFVPFKNTSRSQPGRRTSKSATVKMSSMKVLLSGVARFKSVDQPARNKEDGIDFMVTPLSNRPVTSKKEMVLNSVQGTRPPGLCKLATIDSGFGDLKTTEQPVFVPNNPLSDKVLVWLDLATQSGNIDKEVAPVRVIPIHILEKSSRTSPVSPQELADSSILKQVNDNNASTEVIVYSKQEIQTQEEDFYHVLTPRVGEDSVCKEIMDGKKDGKDMIAKRQLHIFMPNLPKKSSECDSSLLSSLISSRLS